MTASATAGRSPAISMSHLLTAGSMKVKFPERALRVGQQPFWL
jgi:hypothetical protein